jgi:hypothetical protein
MGPKNRALPRCLLCFIAAVVAVLLPAFPALSQEPPECLSTEADVPLTQDKPAAQPATPNTSQEQNSQVPKEPDKKNDRMFYVMPNYLTVENEAHVPPISWKEKFSITAKGAFDPYEFAIVGILAGIRQADNAYPAFGQGWAGYGKRYGTAFADQVDGNIMVGAVFPTILKTDPRYFRLGKGVFLRRFGYAISRVFITRRDSGGSLFNFPEFVGNATAITISNVYYPAANRSVTSGVNNWGVQMGIDAFGNELKEFWPDIHRYFFKRRHPSPPPGQDRTP